MYLAIAAAGAALWVVAALFAVAVCRVAARSGSAHAGHGIPDSNSLLGRSSSPSRAVASSTAREAGEALVGS
jgi:hypothetical protein